MWFFSFPNLKTTIQLGDITKCANLTKLSRCKNVLSTEDAKCQLLLCQEYRERIFAFHGKVLLLRVFKNLTGVKISRKPGMRRLHIFFLSLGEINQLKRQGKAKDNCLVPSQPQFSQRSINWD